MTLRRFMSANFIFALLGILAIAFVAGGGCSGSDGRSSHQSAFAKWLLSQTPPIQPSYWNPTIEDVLEVTGMSNERNPVVSIDVDRDIVHVAWEADDFANGAVYICYNQYDIANEVWGIPAVNVTNSVLTLENTNPSIIATWRGVYIAYETVTDLPAWDVLTPANQGGLQTVGFLAGPTSQDIMIAFSDDPLDPNEWTHSSLAGGFMLDNSLDSENEPNREIHWDERKPALALDPSTQRICVAFEVRYCEQWDCEQEAAWDAWNIGYARYSDQPNPNATFLAQTGNNTHLTNPDLAVSALGRFKIAYQQEITNNSIRYYNGDIGQHGNGTIINISTGTTTNNQLPRIDIDSEDYYHIVWQREGTPDEPRVCYATNKPNPDEGIYPNPSHPPTYDETGSGIYTIENLKQYDPEVRVDNMPGGEDSPASDRIVICWTRLQGVTHLIAVSSRTWERQIMWGTPHFVSESNNTSFYYGNSNMDLHAITKVSYLVWSSPDGIWCNWETDIEF